MSHNLQPTIRDSDTGAHHTPIRQEDKMDMERIRQITRERIAASQEQAVRDLVRANAMLADEVEMLRDEVRRLRATLHSQNPGDICACAGCLWWDDRGLSDPATRCESGATPEPWYRAAADGGMPGCPNYTPACRVCEVARATGDDGLCDGCRGARTLEVANG